MEYNGLFIIKAFKAPLKVLFSLTCFCLVGYMTFLQFQAYIANEDSSVISYKEFDQDSSNAYPTFSICLFGRYGRIFNPHSFPFSGCRYPCSNATYLMHHSAECKGDCTVFDSNRMWKTMVGSSNNVDVNYNVSAIEFEDMVFQILPVITQFKTRTKEGKNIIRIPHHLGKSSKSVFSTTYHDGEYVCYTKEKDTGEDVLLNYDYLEINPRQMLRFLTNYELRFFVHQRGELLRKLGTPTMF